MDIKKIINEKKEWRAYAARVKMLPRDYQIVYKELQKYLFKTASSGLSGNFNILYGIIELFEEGAALGKGAIEVTGTDAAEFCDNLLKAADAYTDAEMEAADKKAAEAVNKYYSRK